MRKLIKKKVMPLTAASLVALTGCATIKNVKPVAEKAGAKALEKAVENEKITETQKGWIENAYECVESWFTADSGTDN